MNLPETTVPYVGIEVDYDTLRGDIERAFQEKFGLDAVIWTRVAHFNPDVIDVTLFVRQRERSMDRLADNIRDLLLQQGLRVAIRITEEMPRLTFDLGVR